MKKHQLAAMVLSALSAGILISCSKPSDESQSSEKKQEVQTNNATETNTEKDNADIVAIELSSEAAKSYLDQVAANRILAAYNNAVKQSQALNSLAVEQCQANNQTLDADKLALLRAQWLELAKAWAYAEIINFGPAMDSMSNLYINYYPDERGLVHQGVIDVIASKPKLTVAELKSESAIVQGIPGIEEVLYANDSLDAAQCNYVITASDALLQRLTDVQQAWKKEGTQLLGIDDAGSKLAMNRWINSILSLVETTKSAALDQPLGLTGNKKGHLPAQAAGQSREILTAKVAALSDALTDPVLVAILSENNNDTLADEISTVLADTSTLLAQLPEDIAAASPEQQQELYDKLTALTQIIKHKLMPTLDVQVGFNSTDGD